MTNIERSIKPKKIKKKKKNTSKPERKETKRAFQITAGLLRLRDRGNKIAVIESAMPR